jgi:hypothetical protein
MRSLLGMISTLAALMSAASSSAEVALGIAVRSNGGPLTAMDTRDVLTIDITLRREGETVSEVGGAAFDYADESIDP